MLCLPGHCSTLTTPEQTSQEQAGNGMLKETLLPLCLLQFLSSGFQAQGWVLGYRVGSSAVRVSGE